MEMPFGKRQQDLKFLEIAQFTLSKMGVDLNTLKGRDLIKNIWKFLFFMFCNLYSEWGLVHYILKNLKQIEVATRSLSISIQGFLILIKMTIFLVKGDKCMKLIWDMNQLAKEANSQELRTFREENRLALLISRLYFFLCWMAVCISGSVPIIFMVYGYIKNSSYDRIFPLEAIFPLDGDAISLLIFNYINCIIYIYTLLNMTVGIDSIYSWCIFNISAHFRILRCKVESIALKLENNDDESFAEDVAAIVCYHIKILEFIEIFNDIFGSVLLAEVTLSCLQMCFIINNVKYEQDVAKMPFNVISSLAITMQLMIYCFGGQKIKNESLILSSDLYLCFPWHKMSSKQHKLLLFPLMRSQKLSVLRGIFFEADNNLLVYIMKTAFSYNALLNALGE